MKGLPLSFVWTLTHQNSWFSLVFGRLLHARIQEFLHLRSGNVVGKKAMFPARAVSWPYGISPTVHTDQTNQPAVTSTRLSFVRWQWSNSDFSEFHHQRLSLRDTQCRILGLLDFVVTYCVDLEANET